ncbi:MAG TPA: DUF4142 domain-containing protein [Micromonosporaceae bacterium]|nr:DUF4142 domain-containing protein [Micromonosporaceae bacterium]
MRGVKRLGLAILMASVGLAPAAAANAAGKPSNQDRQFLTQIHQVNLSEISDGKMAQQKGVNQQVKDLGARFVTDHTDLDKKVKDTASSVNVSLPNSPTAEQKRVENELKGLSGNEFDQRWVATELAGHLQAIQLTQAEVDQGSEASVKKLAQEALPVLESHRDALLELARQLGVQVPTPTASPGATGSPGPTGTGSPGPTGTGSPGPTGTGTPSPTGTETAPGPTGTETSPAPTGS